MNVGQIFGAITKRIDDTITSGTPALDNVYWSLDESFCAVNEAQNMFALLTLCLEASGSVPLTGGRCFYGIRGYLPGYLLPLRVTVGGVRIQPAKLTDLDARYFAWPAVSGTPAKYCQIGLNLFAIVPQPGGSSAAVVAYAKEPAVLAATGDVPEIPEEYHQALVKYSAYYLLQKRGGQYLQLSVSQWREFLTDAAQCADYVRRRNRARQYDNEPAEIRLPVQKEGALTNG